MYIVLSEAETAITWNRPLRPFGFQWNTSGVSSFHCPLFLPPFHVTKCLYHGTNIHCILVPSLNLGTSMYTALWYQHVSTLAPTQVGRKTCMSQVTAPTIQCSQLQCSSAITIIITRYLHLLNTELDKSSSPGCHGEGQKPWDQVHGELAEKMESCGYVHTLVILGSCGSADWI